MRSHERGGWQFFHGHQRSDWRLWRYIAPELNNFLVTMIPPELWYWLNKKLWGCPAQISNKEGESERYRLLVAAIHSAWIRYAVHNRINVMIGHTHFTFSAEWSNHQFVDVGSLRDGYYAMISDGVAKVCRIGEIGVSP